MPDKTNPQEVEDFILDTLAEFGPQRSDLVRGASLEALDVDSLDVVELSQVVEERFDIELKPEVFTGSKTVGDLVDRVLAIVCA